MPHYKDPAGQVHSIPSVEFEHLLPKGCVKITDAKALELAAAQEVPPTYADKRRAEYPPVTDYLDAIVKGDTGQAQAYIDACLAVKAKYPKTS